MVTSLVQKSENVHHVIGSDGVTPIGLIVKGTRPYPRFWGFSPSLFGKKGRPGPSLGDFASLKEAHVALDPEAAMSSLFPMSTLIRGALFGQRAIRSDDWYVGPSVDDLKMMASAAPPLLDLATAPAVVTGGTYIAAANWETCSPEVFADTSSRDDWRLAIVTRFQTSPSGGWSLGQEIYLWFAHESGPRGWGKDGLFGSRSRNFHSDWTPEQVASIENVRLLIDNYQE